MKKSKYVLRHCNPIADGQASLVKCLVITSVTESDYQEKIKGLTFLTILLNDV